MDKAKNARTARRAIKFQSGDEESLSSSDEDEPALASKHFAPRSLSSASSATLTNSRTNLKPPSRPFADVPEYSDYEEDLTEVGHDKPSRDDPNWTPEFIRRHSLRSSTTHVDTPPSTSQTSASDSHQQLRQGSPPRLLSPDALSSAPATPSLIRAVDRITAAYAAQAIPPKEREGLPTPSGVTSTSDRPWEAFWADVKAKAQT